MQTDTNNTATTKPEWIRPADVRRIFGLSRTHVYGLILANKITSRVLRKRGNINGIRLISYDSLAEYIKQNGEETPATTPEQLAA